MISEPVVQYLPPGSGNPLSRIIAGLSAVLLMVVAVLFGMVFLAAAVGLALLGWLALNLRIAWLRRQMRHHSGGGHSPAGEGGAAPDAKHGQVIDADYEVISRGKDD